MGCAVVGEIEPEPGPRSGKLFPRMTTSSPDGEPEPPLEKVEGGNEVLDEADPGVDFIVVGADGSPRSLAFSARSLHRRCQSKSDLPACSEGAYCSTRRWRLSISSSWVLSRCAISASC